MSTLKNKPNVGSAFKSFVPASVYNEEKPKDGSEYKLDKDAHAKYIEFCKKFDIDIEKQWKTKIEVPASGVRSRIVGFYGVKGTTYTANYTSVGGVRGMALKENFILSSIYFIPHRDTTFLDSYMLEGETLHNRGSETVNFDIRDLFPIAEGAVAEKLDKLIRDERKRLEEERKKKQREEAMDKIAYIKRSYIDYLTPIGGIDTQVSFLERGTFAVKENVFIKYDRMAVTEVCGFFKEGSETDDYNIYVPMDWLNPRGYDEEFVKMWVNFINEMGFGEVRYEGKVSYPEHTEIFPDKYVKTALINDAYYKFYIPQHDSNHLSYLKFLMIRYLHYNGFNHLPYMAIKLKEHQPELSNWQALLMVHSLATCNGHYCIVNARDASPKKLGALPLVFDESCKEEKVMNNIINTGVIVHSIPMSQKMHSYHKLNLLFNAEDFEGVVKFYKEAK